MKLATLCYLRDLKKGKTLMIHRIKKTNDYHEGKWNGLGGKLDPGESPEDCVIREVREESGFIISNPVMKGFITFPLFDGVDDWYVFLFTADKFEGGIIDSAEGELMWISDEKLSGLNLWEGDKIFIKWIFQEKFFSAKFLYHEGKYVSHEVFFY
jgi:8-oxo-dGTP diphosphatase